MEIVRPIFVLSILLFMNIIFVTCTSASSNDRDAKFDALVERVMRLEERDQRYQDEIRTLREELHSQKRRTLILESVVQHLTAFATTTKSQPTNADQEQTIEGESSISKTNPAKSSSNRIRRGGFDKDISFTATLTNHQSVNQNQAVLFDNVVTNTGNAYHSHLGSFIAPVAGSYVFSTTIMVAWHNDCQYSIVKNGVPMSYIHCYAKDTAYDTSSQTIVLQLQPNDDVNIRSLLVSPVTAHSTYSSFTGFLLQQQYDSEIVG